MKVKKNDTVLVVAGRDAGKVSKVVACQPKDNKVLVDGVNVQKKHKKPRSAQDAGGIIEQVGAIDASNVMVICPSCNKAVRVAYQGVKKEKMRVCKKCGSSLDVAKEPKKAVKKAAKKAKKATAEAN